MKKRIDNQEQSILTKFKKCFKEFLNMNDIQDLIPYVTRIDKCKTSEGKIENIQRLTSELDKLYGRLEYLIHCANILLSRVYCGNLVKTMNYKRKLQVTEKEFYCLLDFKMLLYKELKKLEEQIENLNIK